MKIKFIFFAFCLSLLKSWSQIPKQLDSLLALESKSTKQDTSRINLLLKISFQFATLDTSKADLYANKAYSIAKSINDDKSLGNCMNNFGRRCYFKRQFPKAIAYFEKASLYFETCNYKKGLGSALNNIGAIYKELGEYQKSIEYQKKSLAINTEIKNEEAIANNNVNLGNCYNDLGKYRLAMDHFIKAQAVYEKLKNRESLSIVFQNLSNIHFNLRQIPKAKEYAYKNLELRKTKASDKIATSYANIILASIFLEEKDLINARKYFNEALIYSNEMGDQMSLAYVYLNYSKIYTREKKYDSALVSAKKSLQISKDMGAKQLLLESINLLADANYYAGNFMQAEKDFKEGYILAQELKNETSISNLSYGLGKSEYELGKYKIAYDHLLIYAILKDSILSKETLNLTSEMNAKYEAEKKDLQIKNQSLEIDAKQKQNEAKTRLLWFGALAIVSIAIFAFFAFKNYHKTKRANLIIESQKAQVEFKNEEITRQKELVDIKQKEIIDSINYAKRIQQAVLTGEDVWNKISKEHFIVFKPKDIVSGDFYWAYNTPNGRSVFALADCTGHGVPGGFMSMLGNSFLNEIVVENKIFKADEILNKLRSKIISALEQKGMTEQKDGMDISLCVWNKMDNTLEFAGANNPLWLLRHRQITEYKADKMPIGTYLETEHPFNSMVIPLQKGDIIYLSTDGYADQFGGERGKKMKYKPFMDLLIRISDQDTLSQKENLERTFEAWKGSYEQIDDVSVIGIKVI